MQGFKSDFLGVGTLSKIFLGLAVLLMIGGGWAAPTLNSISIIPNPALVTDNITITASGDSVQVSSGGGQLDFNSTGSATTSAKWFCQSFVASETGFLHSIGFKLTAGDLAHEMWKVTVYDFSASDELGAVLSQSSDRLSPLSGETACGASTMQYVDDFNVASTLTQGVSYFVCGQTLSGDTIRKCSIEGNDGNFFYNNEATYPSTVTPVNETLTMDVRISDNEPVRLVVKLPGGDYTSNFLVRSSFFSENPFVTTIPPISSGSVVFQAKIEGATTGFSGEVQEIFSVVSQSGIAGGEGVGIYIQASDQGGFSDPLDQGSKMHHWSVFSADSGGGNVGRIRIDGGLTNTCNYTWDCQVDLNVGTHRYILYSSNGDFLYIGNFSVDFNQAIVKIYIPITYNIFDVYTDSSQTTLLDCSSISSVDIFGHLDTGRRVSAGLLGNNNVDIYLNSENVIVRNCYVEAPFNINQLFTHALPGYTGVGLLSGTEPLHIQYTDAYLGPTCTNGCTYGSHILSGPGSNITGGRNRQGLTNFYKLDAITNFVPGSGQTWSGYVSQRTDFFEDGQLSPLASITEPTMNIDSALFGDANYNPGDFGLGDNIYCEAQLSSHGYTSFDVNILLITDKNAIYDNYSFSPYKKYNFFNSGLSNNGWGNIVWHKFSDVNIARHGTVQCAFQITNEIGYKSGWALSKARTLFATNKSTAGGVSIFVKDEDGSISQLRHEAPSDSDLNVFDLYNFGRNIFEQHNTGSSPFTLDEGENVIILTKDNNTDLIASKIFNVDRGASFTINLYLPDLTSDNHTPVIRSAQLRERSAFGRMECKAEFYDQDLDFTTAIFKFWTSRDGSYASPTCEETVTGAFTTNCNLLDPRNFFTDKCLATSYNDATMIVSECGTDNDCFVEASFSKRGCTSLAGGSTTGYCAITVGDANNNITTSQASAAITIQQYQVFAICESYALIDGAKENIIFTEQDTGYVECEIGVDNFLDPDTNFSVSMEGKSLAFLQSNFDSYLERTTHVYRADATSEFAAYAEIYSSDGETWEGEIPVLITHSVYGSLDSFVHAAVTFSGTRFIVDEDVPVLILDGNGFFGMSFTDFQGWFAGMVNGFLLMITNPIGWIQGNFFVFLIVIFLIIVGAPLVLYGMSITAKRKGEG